MEIDLFNLGSHGVVKAFKHWNGVDLVRGSI